MICCLNPECIHPNNPDHHQTCQTCGHVLINRLRNRYQPIKLIGQGGFGRTYLAEDLDRLKSTCVIKQFTHAAKSSATFDKALELFNQEALRLNELGEHPQIPTLLAYFEHQDQLYLVQQWIEGHTLLEEIQNSGAFDEEKIRQVLSSLLPVLQFIHDRKVVHRDINPTNILRRRVDHQLVLIDFGIAKQLETSLVGETVGTRIGTEGYSPIEQLRSGVAYPSSDLYSLGATCLCLLTASKPENLYSPLEGRWLWREKLHQRDRTLSPQLGDILDKLVKDLISDRYASAMAVQQDLIALPSLPQAVPAWTSLSDQGLSGRKQDSPSGQSLFGRSAAGTSSGTPGPAIDGNAHGQSPSMSNSGGAGVRSSSTLSSDDKTSGAKSSQPRVSQPRVSQPRVSQPRVSQPRVSQPRVSQPRVSQPRALDSNRNLSGPVTATPLGEPSRWQLLRSFEGNRSWVSTVTFNPILPMIASSGLDDTIRIWDLETGELTHSLSGHSRAVNDLAFSPNGQILASASDDTTICLWNLGTGKVMQTLQGHRRDVTAVAFGTQGTLVASGSEDCSIAVWSVDRGKLLKSLTSPGMVKSIAITPDEQWLLSGGFDNKIRVWQLANGTVSQILSGHLNSINDLAISQDGRLLASASKDRTVRLWSLRSGQLIHVLQDHTRDVNAVALTPDRRTVVSASSDNTLKVWDAQTGELIETLTAHANPVTAVAIHATGDYLASASSDKTITLWQRR